MPIRHAGKPGRPERTAAEQSRRREPPLLHLLLVTTPRALVFFGWIMVLATAIGLVMPLSLATGLDARLTTAILNLVIGRSITFTLSSVARSAAPRASDD
ncbi:hypothetical protein PV458_14820 [Streptomyces sp. MN03-5084-2B]|nr:hypothetical protein [Streptomyces sp. MN03-5084-2B]